METVENTEAKSNSEKLGQAQAQPQNEELKKIVSRTPADVLMDNMLFYDKEAKNILAEIIAGLKVEGKNPVLLAQMYKYFQESAAMAIDCANKLAPYKHAKLANIELKGELTKRYVIQAPSVAASNDAWLESAQKAISQEAILKNAKFEDAEVVE